MLDRANYVKSNQSYNRITDEYRESSSRDLAIVGAAYAHIFSHTQLVGQAGVPPMDKEVCVWIDVDALGLSNFFVWLDSRLFSDKRPNESLAKHTHIFTLFAGVWRIPKERERETERDRERYNSAQTTNRHKQATKPAAQTAKTISRSSLSLISHLSSLSASLSFSLSSAPVSTRHPTRVFVSRDFPVFPVCVVGVSRVFDGFVSEACHHPLFVSTFSSSSLL